jgi:hypothetical protein
MTTRLSSEMTCEQLVELVTSYLEGKMELPERAKFEQHVLYCGGCAAYLQQFRQQLRVSGTLKETDVATPVREDLLEAFRRWKARRGGPL